MWLVTAAAFAQSNATPQFGLALVHQGGAESPWGVEASVGGLASLGSGAGVWYPIAGARGFVTWRGAGRFGVGAEASAGAGALAMEQYGFLPDFTATADVGLVAEIQGPFGPTIGGTVAKSLSYTDVIQKEPFRSSRIYGLQPLALALGAQRAPGGTLRWDAGLRLTTYAASELALAAP